MAGEKIALSPQDITIPSTGPNSTVTLEAFCGTAACNLQYFAVGSNAKVGSIDTTFGPQTRFHANGVPGTAIVIVKDDAGNMAFTKVTVVQTSLR